MAITQISLFLMNQPGQLVDAVGAISGAGSNIRAMSISEANDFGILRAIVTDTDKVCEALKEKYLITRTPVVAARMDDRHGALHPILVALNESNINIEYMYAFTGTPVSSPAGGALPPVFFFPPLLSRPAVPAAGLFLFTR